MSFETIEGVLEEFKAACPSLHDHTVELYEDDESIGFKLSAYFALLPVVVTPVIPKDQVELMAPMWDRILQLTFQEMVK